MKRYWVYTHDLDGELVESLGDTESFGSAIDLAAHEIMSGYFALGDIVIRIVDNMDNAQTCWISGPVDYMKKYFSENSR